MKAATIFLTGWLVVPWLYGIVDAVRIADDIKSGRRESVTVPPGYLLVVIKFVIVPFACLVWGIFMLLLGILRLLFGW